MATSWSLFPDKMFSSFRLRWKLNLIKNYLLFSSVLIFKNNSYIPVQTGRNSIRRAVSQFDDYCGSFACDGPRLRQILPVGKRRSSSNIATVRAFRLFTSFWQRNGVISIFSLFYSDWLVKWKYPCAWCCNLSFGRNVKWMRIILELLTRFFNPSSTVTTIALPGNGCLSVCWYCLPVNSNIFCNREVRECLVINYTNEIFGFVQRYIDNWKNSLR